MKKNARINVVLDSEELQKFKAKAKENQISLSALCRQSVRKSSSFENIENLLQEILENVKTNSNKSDN